MKDLNTVNLEGRLVRDPDFRQTPSGTPICDITIANNRSYKGVTRTVFVTTTTWNKQAEALSKLLHTGDLVRISAELVDDNYSKKQDDGTEFQTHGRLKLGGKVSLEVLRFKNPKPSDEEVSEDVSETQAA